MKQYLSAVEALEKSRSYLSKILLLYNKEWKAFAREAKVKTLQKKEHFSSKVKFVRNALLLYKAMSGTMIS